MLCGCLNKTFAHVTFSLKPEIKNMFERYSTYVSMYILYIYMFYLHNVCMLICMYVCVCVWGSSNFCLLVLVVVANDKRVYLTLLSLIKHVFYSYKNVRKWTGVRMRI